MYLEGVHSNEIALMLGVTRQALYKFRIKHNIPKYSGESQEELIEIIREEQTDNQQTWGRDMIMSRLQQRGS